MVAASCEGRKTKCFGSSLQKVERSEVINAGETREWFDIQLLVPPVVSSELAGCTIINVSYVVRVGWVLFLVMLACNTKDGKYKFNQFGLHVLLL